MGSWTWDEMNLLAIRRLHYHGIHETYDPLRGWDPQSEYERYLYGKFQQIPVSDIALVITQLIQGGQVTKKGPFWTLTKQGAALAYGLCEYDIQKLSGLWQEIFKLAKPRPRPRRVLDIGCGGGLTGLILSQNGFLGPEASYYGIDCDAAALEAGRMLISRNPGATSAISLSEGNALGLPFPDHTFDFVLSKGVFCYLPMRKAVQEAFRVLMPQGYLVVIVPTMQYMLHKAVAALKSFQPRPVIRYSTAVLLGLASFFGIRNPRQSRFFVGETIRGVQKQIEGIPNLKTLFLQRLSVPFLSRPIALIAQKAMG
ncbi:MAG: class I SAM-dependent methyltransferase [Deltaproteobacteria bacterium]|nr:class I SAM-dependent methyltransferase [Deltaproteobacteria bacterium]